MKIVLVNSLYSPHFVGGAERSVQALAEGLLGLGHGVTVVSTADQASNTDAEVNGVKVHYLAYKNAYWTYEDRPRGKVSKAVWHARDTYSPAMGREVQRVVSRESPDVVHTNNIVGLSVAVWDAVHALGVPVVHTLRDYYLMCPSSTMFRRGRSCDRPCAGCSLFGAARRFASRRVSAVAGVSEFILRKHLRSGYFPDAVRAQAIRTGHDPKPCEATRREPDADGPLVVGFLGCVSPNKGIEVLLRAVDSFPEGRVTCRVGGTGRSEYQADLRRRFARPNVEFLGQTPAPEFLRSVDVLVVASLWEEPLARVIIESLSHGTPVVTTPRGGSPEVVRNGFNGIVCEDDGVESMAGALRRLVDDREYLLALRRNAAANPEVNTVRMMSERYLDLYESAARPRPARAPRRLAPRPERGSTATAPNIPRETDTP